MSKTKRTEYINQLALELKEAPELLAKQIAQQAIQEFNETTFPKYTGEGIEIAKGYFIMPNKSYKVFDTVADEFEDIIVGPISTYSIKYNFARFSSTRYNEITYKKFIKRFRIIEEILPKRLK